MRSPYRLNRKRRKALQRAERRRQRSGLSVIIRCDTSRFEARLAALAERLEALSLGFGLLGGAGIRAAAEFDRFVRGAEIASGCITPGYIQAGSIYYPDGSLSRLTDETVRILSGKLKER